MIKLWRLPRGDAVIIKTDFSCIYFRVCPIRRWGWLREAKTSQVFLSSSLLRSVLTFMKSFSTSVLNDLYNHRNHHCDLIILEEQVIVLILLPLLVLLVKLQVIPNFYHFWSIHYSTNWLWPQRTNAEGVAEEERRKPEKRLLCLNSESLGDQLSSIIILN